MPPSKATTNFRCGFWQGVVTPILFDAISCNGIVFVLISYNGRGGSLYACDSHLVSRSPHVVPTVALSEVGSSGSHDGKNHLATSATIFGFAPRRLGCVGRGTDELGSTVWHTSFSSKVIAFIFSSSSHIRASNALYFSAQFSLPLFKIVVFCIGGGWFTYQDQPKLDHRSTANYKMCI